MAASPSGSGSGSGSVSFSAPDPASLHGLSLSSLKLKAALPDHPAWSLKDWIVYANMVINAAEDADKLAHSELAYTQYYKAASILQLILSDPSFKNLKSSNPNLYRLYLDVAPIILASTERAKQLAQQIENQLPSPNRSRQIAGGISSRIKTFEAAAAARRPPNRPDSPLAHHHPLSPAPNSPRRRPPIPPSHPQVPNTQPQLSFVATALEANSTVRSGSAPPDLSLDSPLTIPNALKSNSHTIMIANSSRHQPSPSDVSLQHLSLRSPSQFDQAFPALDHLSLDPHPSHSLPDLPSVPNYLPSSPQHSLPPPPQPFHLPSQDSGSDQLLNDTSLGAGLSLSDLNPGPPPPYPDFAHSSLPLSPTTTSLSRSYAIKNHNPPSRRSVDGPPSPLPQKPAPSYSSSPPTLPTNTHEILPAVLIDYFRKSASAGVDTKVLFLDLRERDEFESCRIKSTDVVCIEPIVVSKNGGRGVSGEEIEQSLIVSPRKEQVLFEQRHEFEYVIMYDRRSVQLPLGRPRHELLQSSEPSEEASRLLLLLYLAIHEQAYVKRLKQRPLLLSGGIEGWTKVAGEAGIVGRGSGGSRTRQGSMTREFSSSMNGIPITLRQPINEEDERLDSQDEKRARRTIALVQRDSPAPTPVPVAGFIARSVADLTRPGPNGSPHPPASSSSMPNMYPSRLPVYGGPNGAAASPITLPQQTLQRAKSSQAFDGPSGELGAVYGTPAPHPPLYQTQAATPSVTPVYGAHQPLLLAPRVDAGYGGYIPNTLRPTIQYPSLHSRPPQPPPVAMKPGESTHFSRQPAYGPTPPQPALLSAGAATGQRDTPPITPYSPGKHGSSEAYFNPSFEDGQIGLTGLKNLGNTCYMNSTLQCISATIPLARFFKDGSYKRCINRSNPLGTQGQLAESVAELVRVLWSAQYTFVSPITFREAICRFAPQFRGSDQHDAQEFLGFLLDGLHEDLNLVTCKPPAEEMSAARAAALETLPTAVAAKQEWAVYKRRDNSVVVELFQGQYRSRLQCLTCSTTSTTYNTFMYLSLPIPTKRGISKVSLTQCLDAFLKEEIMEKDDAWNCPRCKTRRKATKRLSIARLPPILLIHLKRFSFKGPFSDKLETFVQYPVYGLDLSGYLPPGADGASEVKSGGGGGEAQRELKSETGWMFDLYAVVNHFGSLSSGHYTAFTRSQKDWYNVGDSRVSKIDEKAVKARSAYLLCFRRR